MSPSHNGLHHQRHSDLTILEILQNNISPLKWKLVDFSSARSILRVDWMAKLYQTSKWTAWICFLVILIIGPLSLQGVEIFATQLTNVWVNFEGEKKNCYSLMKWRTFQRCHIPSILLVSGSYKKAEEGLLIHMWPSWLPSFPFRILFYFNLASAVTSKTDFLLFLLLAQEWRTCGAFGLERASSTK